MDWRDAAAYAPLLDADRSFFAWEWLRRNDRYRTAADRALSKGSGGRGEDRAAAAFGLVGFENPDLSVPYARPVWRAEVHPQVLEVERSEDGGQDDQFPLDRLGELAVLVACGNREHLLLSDGLRAVRLDAPSGTFDAGAVLRYELQGLASLEPAILTLRRLLALCRRGRFSRTLHPRVPRASRWVLALRTWDALASGACQREIAGELLSRSVSASRWRVREPSIRSQAQRLVRAGRLLARGGYRAFLS